MEDINSITFELDNYTIQLVNDRVLIWKGSPIGEPDFDMSATLLNSMIQRAYMLRKSNEGE